jgi:exodeoxyribonuclease VII small subunit
MKKNSFESSLKRLEQIVNEMENAELDIDKAMKLLRKEYLL